MTQKIFLIEDEVAFLYALQAKLRLEGFDVEVASDGQTALDRLKNYKPDIILLDIILPKVDGWEVLQQIKADQRLVNVPVIIISNLSDKHSQEKGVDLGANDYLVKSDYDLDALVKKINESLQKADK